MAQCISELQDATLEELKMQIVPNEDPANQADYDLNKAVLDYTELLKAEIPERKMILPWLPEGGLAMVYAERGLGKTHFALSLASAIVSSNKFMKWSISNPSGVMYVDGEMGLVDIRQRLSDFNPTLPVNPLKILSHELFYQHFEHDLSLTDSNLQAKLLAELDQNRQIRVLIIDNLSSLSRIREDKADDWRAHALPFLLACRRRGVAVVLIHHTGKGGDQRGTGAREDQLDTSIKLERIADANPGQGCQFKLSFTKSRGFYGDDAMPFIATLQSGNQGSYWDISSLEQSSKDRLIGLIEDAGDEGISASQAAKELGVTPGWISALKKELEKEGVIQFTSGKRPLKISANWRSNR